MTILYSAETRWYFEATLPTAVREWFTDAGKGRDEPERTDAYLLLPLCESTSVKLREGRFEVKSLIRPPERASYGGSVTGLQDAWVKWSREAPDADAFLKMIAGPKDTWAFVRKARHLRKFSLDDGEPREVDAKTDRPVSGCQVEITSIRAIVSKLDPPPAAGDWASATPWWSLSLEAFAPHSANLSEILIENLRATAGHFFSSAPPVTLASTSSLSYPAWLARLA